MFNLGQVLHLNGNLLEALPDDIGQLAALRMVSLNGNCLTALPQRHVFTPS